MYFTTSGATGIDRTMTDILKLWGSPDFFTNVLHGAVSTAANPDFLIQCGAIALSGGLAYWASRVARHRLDAAAAALPQSWIPAFRRGCESVALPAIWLGMMWLALIGAGLAGAKDSMLDAAVELLAAWICIRLLSLSVKSALVSVTLSVAVWSIAALSILGVLDTVVRHLDDSAIHVGKYRLSALTVIHAAVALGVLLWLTMVLFRFLERQIERAESLTPSLRVLFIQLLQILMPALAVVIGLSAAGVNLTALTVISGAVFLGIGLGLQKLVGNLVAGLTILIGKSIKPGDTISYKGELGRVTEMGARYVTLRGLNGAEHLIPNEFFLENGVENWSYTDSKIGLSVPVGISYDADPRAAIALMTEAAKAAPRVLAVPEPFAAVKAFGDNAIELVVYFSIDDPQKGTVPVVNDVLLGIWDRFKAAGIGIPYPQRDVHLVSGQ